ncbi:MAG: ribonuclease R, partial [Pseudomonadota bacterium]
HHDRDAQTLMGSDSGRIIGMGQPVTVRLAEATPITGGLLLELLELNGASVGSAPRGKPGRPAKRAQKRAKGKAFKEKRKVERKRKR